MTDRPSSECLNPNPSYVSDHTCRTLFQALPDAVCITKRARFIDVNDAFLRLLKCGRNDLIGKGIFSIVSPGDAEILIKRQERRERGETVDERVEYTVLRFDGSSVIVEASTVWIPEEDILITIMRDITDRKRSENEVQVSKQLLSNVIGSIPIGVWVGDKNFRIKEWNVGQEIMTGVPREEVIGCNIFERFPSLANAGLEEMYRRVVETGEPLILDSVGFYDDTLARNRYVLNIKANALKDANGCITGIVVAVEDITERKLSEERFRMAALSCSDMIYEWDVESGRVEWFGDIDVKLGYTPGEFPRTIDAWENILHPDDRRRVSTQSKQYVKDGQYSQEYRVVLKDGSIHYWTETGIGVTDSSGTYYKWIGAVTDITRRKMAEEALRQSEEHFRLTFDNASIGMVVVGMDDKCMRANQALSEIVGYTTEELKQMTFREITHPDDLPGNLELLGQLLRGEIAKYRLAKRYIRKDGEIIDVILNVSLVRDKDGKPMHGIVQIEDVTEYKKAEQAVRESEAKFRSYINQSMDGVFVVDKTGKYLEVNPAGCKMTGYSEEEFLQMTIGKLTIQDEDTQRENIELFETLVKTGQVNCERVLMRKDGSRFVVDINAVAIDPDRFMGVVRDVTERKKAEEAVLKSLDALEKAYALQSEFVRNMTHEVRTPLTGVIGCARALLDGVTGSVSDEQRRVLKRIVEQAESLLAIVEEVLESARLAAGVKNLDLRALRVDQIVESAAHLATYTAKERKIDIVTQVAPNTPVVVSDAQKLTRILNNLISNAVKFTFHGSVTVTAEKNKTGVDLVIVDTGTGIPEDRQEHIFDAFVQLSYPGKHKPVGAGLGLSIVRELVDALGCSLTLSSVEGLGTAFTLHVPLRHKEMK